MEELDILPGAFLKDAISEALSKALETKCVTTFSFNGVQVVIPPQNIDEALIYRDFWHAVVWGVPLIGPAYLEAIPEAVQDELDIAFAQQGINREPFSGLAS